jgi:hypothetical protein
LTFSYWIDNLGFVLKEDLLLYSSYLPLRVPNWLVIYFIYYTPTSSLALFNTAPSKAIIERGVFSISSMMYGISIW